MKKISVLLISAVILFITGCSASNIPADIEFYDIIHIDDLSDSQDYEAEPEVEADSDVQPDENEADTDSEYEFEVFYRIANGYINSELTLDEETSLIKLIPAEKSPNPEKLPHPDGSAEVIMIVPDFDINDFSEE